MITVYDGKRWEQSEGAHSYHSGTRVYLTQLRATIDEGSARDVANNFVGDDGRLIGEISDA